VHPGGVQEPDPRLLVHAVRLGRRRGVALHLAHRAEELDRLVDQVEAELGQHAAGLARGVVDPP